MNLKFTHFLGLLLVVAIALTSCKSSENGGEGKGTGEGTGDKKAIVHITAMSKGGTTYATPTVDESEIRSAYAYAFDNNHHFAQKKELEEDSYGNFVGDMELTNARHYFHIVVNPSTTVLDELALFETLTSGNGLRDFEKLIFIAEKIEDVADMSSPLSPGLFMTNPFGSIQLVLEPNPQSNSATFPVGRSFAKTSILYDYLTAPQPVDSDGNVIGEIIAIKYAVLNNPKQSNLTANYNLGQLIGAYWTKSAGTVYPNETDYFSEIAIQRTGSDIVDYDYTITGTLRDASNTASTLDPAYAIENSNQTPKNGNVTTALIEGVFLPEAIKDAAGGDLVVGVGYMEGDDFWRVAVVDNITIPTKIEYYLNQFYSAIPDATEKSRLETALGTTELAFIKYKGAKAYYFVPLADYSEADVVKRYTIARNNYYKISVNGVFSLGSNAPVISNPGEGVEDPVDIGIMIGVVDWEDKDQTGGI